MPKVMKVDPVHLVGKKLHLACGHNIMVLGRDVQLALGSERVCEACLRHEQPILSMTKGATDKHRVLPLACGHLQVITLGDHDKGDIITDRTVEHFLGTTMKCNKCAEGSA